MPNTITILLQKWRKGDQGALEELIPIIYEELYLLARSYIKGENNIHTLQPTALINEAIIQLMDDDTNFQNRFHFIAIVANTMRRVLVDYARRENAKKRGGDGFRIELTGLKTSIMPQDIDVLALHEALNKLEQLDSLQMKIVELRFFCGLTIKETAEVLDISTTTVSNEWTMAKTWLYIELNQDEKLSGGTIQAD
jgi:RNA polymerase sigma-70 factor, ECF subfamily